jgi:hypothetical protein
VPLRADRFGLSVALATPFTEDRSIDLPRFASRALPEHHGDLHGRGLFAVTAAVKALVGHRRNDPVTWSRMRAPLRSFAIDNIRAERAA